MSMAQGAILTDRIAETLAGPTPAELAQVMVRIELVCLALVFFGIGLTVLTTPASLVFAVALWLCAAPFIGLAVFGHFRE